MGKVKAIESKVVKHLEKLPNLRVFVVQAVHISTIMIFNSVHRVPMLSVSRAATIVGSGAPTVGYERVTGKMLIRHASYKLG